MEEPLVRVWRGVLLFAVQMIPDCASPILRGGEQAGATLREQLSVGAGLPANGPLATAALECANADVEQHGLPLASPR